MKSYLILFLSFVLFCSKLIDNLVNIKDDSGEFLLKLSDGRVIDTKGWNDWEWTHGVGLYGLYRSMFFHLLDSLCRQTPVSLLYVTHHQDELPRSITHVMHLENGRMRVEKE